MLATQSGFFEPINIPQDIITGIVATFIGLAILFYIKPRLDIQLLQPSTIKSSTERSGKAAFVVKNKGAMQVVEVEAKLFKVDVSVFPSRRELVDLTTSELFQLSGWATPSQRRSVIQGPKGEFRFITKDPLGPTPRIRSDRPNSRNGHDRQEIREQVMILGANTYCFRFGPSMASQTSAARLSGDG
jgi:hypothetical protein